jgi:hypothetical protein
MNAPNYCDKEKRVGESFANLRIRPLIALLSRRQAVGVPAPANSHANPSFTMSC